MSRSGQSPDLKKYMDKKLQIKLNANLLVTGTLRGFDQFMNLVIDNIVEVNGNEKNEIGIVLQAKFDLFVGGMTGHSGGHHGYPPCGGGYPPQGCYTYPPQGYPPQHQGHTYPPQGYPPAGYATQGHYGASHHSGHGGMGALLAGGAAAAAAAMGAHHLSHGSHHGGGYYGGGHYDHHGGMFKHHGGKFKHGKHGKFKRGKLQEKKLDLMMELMDEEFPALSSSSSASSCSSDDESRLNRNVSGRSSARRSKAMLVIQGVHWWLC
ncbi:putative small nuclear ribonucleoprotein G [Capsicum baccatum]|uniref:Small nuclear ribonucleoprotein G n=1 Tax=Capsicum baccatum TaxID=33114 RepID=A0A2G2XM11_CAPBA|nr:putative small nuclear ribonucleoprotein G [Capsicum baccatum]